MIGIETILALLTSPTASAIAAAAASAFTSVLDLIAKYGKVSAEDLESAKQQALARIGNYSTSEAIQRAKEDALARGEFPT